MHHPALPRRRLFASGRIPARRTATGTVLELVTETTPPTDPAPMPLEAA